LYEFLPTFTMILPRQTNEPFASSPTTVRRQTYLCAPRFRQRRTPYSVAPVVLLATRCPNALAASWATGAGR
jgi:hypothetical protein